MTGVLLIDKPSGPTSHDVVARLRRTSGERSIGHTGTLDPRATGLLVLVLGAATRLASMLASGQKTYDATICLGKATDTDDADGQVVGATASALPQAPEVDEALSAFRGALAQLPPAHSAKHVGGERAYSLARRARPVALAPVAVMVHRLDRVSLDGDRLRVLVECSSGFYVRSLARDLGARLGCGAHLASLRRLKSGAFDVDNAVPLDHAERAGREIERRLISAANALADLPAVGLTTSGLTRASHGNPVGPEHLTGRAVPPSTGGRVRLLDDSGKLVALAESRGGALHPVVVIGSEV